MEKKNCASYDEVKSKAVVQYSVPWPAKFVKLQCNTDLNLPPSNWLSNAFDSYGLQHVLYEQQGFSSFRMAHMFPDCVGEVDVVSDAENIKNLLKIPYHKGMVSMMVHRIENTLLLDDFDIYKHLLRTAETEWEWLKRFFCDHFQNIDHEQIYDGTLYFKNRRRKALQEKNLVSKFLYHSIAQGDNENLKLCDIPVVAPLLAEPSPEEVPDPESEAHIYNRTVKWTFEDIQMLIGSDMTIFGQGTHPCISLRLRDMSKPISVLTGIDYWLDNLMANVPEVVMCYHINGIVQKYELIKTEDLPTLDNSKFSPNVIREVAKSILSFLKSNATRAGHTYWLFKPKDQDVVKLYDLTSLCSKDIVDKDESPFTIPVAMLLYRVARNMKHSRSGQQPGTIRMLLKNCIKLLDEKKFPEIVTSSHYMLSDLYIPANTNPENPNFDQQDIEDTDIVYDDDDLPGDENSEESSIKTLTLNSNSITDGFSKHKYPPPVVGSVDERCLQSISHIVSGLECLRYFHQSKNFEKQCSPEKEEILMAKPFEPIPMPFHKHNENKESVTNDSNISPKSLKRNKKRKEKSLKNVETKQNALLLKAKIDAQPLPTWQDFNDDHISWKNHLKILLYEKAELVYATLAEQQFGSCNYGASLRYLGLLVRCHEVLSKLYCSSKTLMEDCLLGRAGDCCIMIVKNWHKVQTFRKDFITYLEEDDKMKEQLEKDEQKCCIRYAESNLRHVLIYELRNVEQLLLKGVELYNEALKYGESESIMLRLGNGLNELSNFYLTGARTESSATMIFEMCSKAEKYLKQGLEVFEKIKNESNVALLYANMGHLHRLLAHASSPTERHELTNKEKMHYNKAFVNYKKALQVLVERINNTRIWDLVNWELSSALFTMATILHDQPNPTLSRADAEKEVSETLHQALKYCDLDEKNPKYPFYQFRAGLIHYRLACLNHSSILNLHNETNRKNTMHLAKLHYEKASNLFFMSMDSINYFTSQMQKFALLEHLSESSTSLQAKFTHYQECLEILCESIPMLQLIIDKKIEIDNSNEDDTAAGKFKSLRSLISLIQNKIQCILRNLTKLCLLKPSINKDCIELCITYKALYASTLTLNSKQDLYNLVVEIYRILLEVSNKIDFKCNSNC